jgi:hypothetical protein
MEELLEVVFSVWSMLRTYNKGQLPMGLDTKTYWLTVSRNVTFTWLAVSQYPCGGGVEYLHRDPASRRRRQKGKSQIWDSKIGSQVPRD